MTRKLTAIFAPQSSSDATRLSEARCVRFAVGRGRARAGAWSGMATSCDMDLLLQQLQQALCGAIDRCAVAVERHHLHAVQGRERRDHLVEGPSVGGEK